MVNFQKIGESWIILMVLGATYFLLEFILGFPFIEMAHKIVITVEGDITTIHKSTEPHMFFMFMFGFWLGIWLGLELVTKIRRK